jgi:hypothetical protein
MPRAKQAAITQRRTTRPVRNGLRRLRDRAPEGRPTSVDKVVAETGKLASRAAIYSALSGKTLPSRETLAAMVIAWSPGRGRCDEDRAGLGRTYFWHRDAQVAPRGRPAAGRGGEEDQLLERADFEGRERPQSPIDGIGPNTR